VPRLVTSALLGEPLTVHGDGRAARDWVFVEDTADAVERVLDAPLETVRGQVFNVGTGKATDVLTLAQRILALTDQKDELIVHTPDRPGQVALHRAGTEKSSAQLGYRTRVALDAGLERTVAWYRDHRSWWEPQLWMRSVPVADSAGRLTYW
jgi:dTDP-glucose 4,6-dehydratase